MKGIHKIVETEYMAKVNDINLTCCSIPSKYQILHIGDVVPHSGVSFVVGWGLLFYLTERWEFCLLITYMSELKCFHAT